MTEYVLIIMKNERDALGAVRGIDGLLVAEDDHIYLRGIDEDKMGGKNIRQLPVLHSYRVDESGRMFPQNGCTPVALLPKLDWLPITQYLKLSLPVSPLPAKLRQREPVTIVKSDITRESCALLTSIDLWKSYAEAAPAARFAHLQFAVAENGDVLVSGSPLPAVPGKEFYSDAGILIAAGYSFAAPLMAAVVAGKLNPGNDAVIMFTASGQWHKIPNSFFVPASRAGIRLTSIMQPE